MYIRTNTKNSDFHILDAANAEFQPNFAPLREGGSAILGHAVPISLARIKNKL